MTEPVATLPACLCGLDTNPVASPRMDVHCPKHDAPGGQPELLACPFCGGRPRFERDARAAAEDIQGPIYQMIACSQCQSGPPWDEEEDDPNAVEQCKARLIAKWNTRVSQPADWLRDNEIKRLTDERNQLAQQGAELWERANTDQPAGEPSDEDEAWIRRLAQRIRHHQMKGYDMYTEDHLVASITDEYQKRRTVAQPSPATVPAFKNSKEAMLYAQRNNIPTVIPVSVATPPTPADEVAQRARAAKVLKHFVVIHRSDTVGDFRVATVDEITVVLTATDVEQGTCTWTCEPAPDIEMWETDCGNAFQFEADGPTENKMKFCCYCGKPLVEAAKES